MLIGGFAVIAYGAGRFTKDIDLLVEDSSENIACVKRGLAVLADNAAAAINDADVRDHVVVRVADEVIVDLMGRACGLTYADVVQDVEWRDLGGVRVPVASPAMLIRTKDTSSVPFLVRYTTRASSGSSRPVASESVQDFAGRVAQVAGRVPGTAPWN